jgi:hypothetical protein
MLLSFFSFLQIGKVPITFTMSIWILASWIFSIAGIWLGGITPLGVTGGWAYSVLVGLLAFMMGMFVASMLVRPMGRFFVTHNAKQRHDYLGHECVIRTGIVNTKFGQAECDDGGSGLLIEIRCDRTNSLQRGQRALIVSFDEAREAYIIEPMPL